ncbi:hypothetical protein GCM10027614_77740 [Micromonospora vulcania]
MAARTARCGRIERAGGELAELVRRRPAAAGPVDPFALTTSFEQLLGRTDS